MGAAVVQAHAGFLDAHQLLAELAHQQALLAIGHAEHRQKGQQREQQRAQAPEKPVQAFGLSNGGGEQQLGNPEHQAEATKGLHDRGGQQGGIQHLQTLSDKKTLERNRQASTPRSKGHHNASVERQAGHDLHLRLPQGHWQALERHCLQSGESHSAVLRKALADYLDLEHHTLWQLSTSTAVVEGVFGGSLQVKDLADHGDFGIGTFEQLDGEGILLDGICWQARADGSVCRAPADEGIPFWVATHFEAQQRFSLSGVDSIEALGAQLDPQRPGANLFVAIRITGLFDEVLMRSVSKVPKGVGLLEASQDQTMVRRNNIRGTLAGFWSPEHTTSLNIPGYHFHFLADDHSSGGHVLDVQAAELQVELDLQSNLRLALPQTKEFLEADLSGDIAATLHTAESKPKDGGHGSAD